MEEGTEFPEALLRGLISVVSVRLPEQPRLAPWLTQVDLGDDRVQLRAVDFALTISDKLLSQAFLHIAPMLDGTHSVAEIVDSGGREFLSGTVEIVLKLLRQRGALHEGKVPAPMDPEARRRFDPALRLFAHYAEDPEVKVSRLQSAKVTVHGDAALCSEIRSALEAVGIGNVVTASSDEALGAAEGHDLLIAAARTTGVAYFGNVNRICLERGIRWLRVAYEGRCGIVGPTIVPRQTACFACYLQRRETHEVLDGWAQYQAKIAKDGEPDEGVLAPLTNVVASQAALETARLISGFAPPVTVGRFYTFESGTPKVSGHDVLRVPRCASCGPRQGPRDPWATRSPASEDAE